MTSEPEVSGGGYPRRHITWNSPQSVGERFVADTWERELNKVQPGDPMNYLPRVDPVRLTPEDKIIDTFAGALNWAYGVGPVQLDPGKAYGKSAMAASLAAETIDWSKQAPRDILADSVSDKTPYDLNRLLDDARDQREAKEREARQDDVWSHIEDIHARQDKHQAGAPGEWRQYWNRLLDSVDEVPPPRARADVRFPSWDPLPPERPDRLSRIEVDRTAPVYDIPISFGGQPPTSVEITNPPDISQMSTVIVNGEPFDRVGTSGTFRRREPGPAPSSDEAQVAADRAERAAPRPAGPAGAFKMSPPRQIEGGGR